MACLFVNSRLGHEGAKTQRNAKVFLRTAFSAPLHGLGALAFQLPFRGGGAWLRL